MAKKEKTIKIPSDNTKLSTIIKRAGKTAKGIQYLSNNGHERCLWGQVAHLVGVSDARLHGRVDLFQKSPIVRTSHLWKDDMETVCECPGNGLWDNGQRKRAVKAACAATEGMTVSRFRYTLGVTGLLGRPR